MLECKLSRRLRMHEDPHTMRNVCLLYIDVQHVMILQVHETGMVAINLILGVFGS